jgi:superfamily I DNA and RNA helicase
MEELVRLCNTRVLYRKYPLYICSKWKKVVWIVNEIKSIKQEEEEEDWFLKK